MKLAKFVPLLVILITAPVIAHDPPLDPRVMIPSQHFTYVIGMKASLRVTGATPHEQMLINDFFTRWQDAVKEANAQKAGLTRLEYFHVYSATLKKHGIQCGGPIWIDTRTNQYCE